MTGEKRINPAFGNEMLQLLTDRGVVDDALRVVLASPGIDISVKVTSEEMQA